MIFSGWTPLSKDDTPDRVVLLLTPTLLNLHGGILGYLTKNRVSSIVSTCVLYAAVINHLLLIVNKNRHVIVVGSSSSSSYDVNNMSLLAAKSIPLVSKEILQRVDQNDENVNAISIRGNFISSIHDGYSWLGLSIAKNTNISFLQVSLYDYDGEALVITDKQFFNGLKDNSSICELTLEGSDDIDNNIIGDVGHRILAAYQENNNLTFFKISDVNVRVDRGGDVIAATLKSCTNLTYINLKNCSITDEVMLNMICPLKKLNLLEKLHLTGNNIGNSGCEAIAQLLVDPGNNLCSLGLSHNNITNVGAKAIINSLVHNTKLKGLFLYGNAVDEEIEETFTRVLCNTSSVDDTYLSNHTLDSLVLPHRTLPKSLSSLLKLNKKADKKNVAIEKILQYHPNIDMSPIYELVSPEEHSLKGLPLVIGWFERARQRSLGKSYGVDKRSLSSIYQFALSMPLSFPPGKKTIYMLYWKKDNECQELKKENEEKENLLLQKDIECQKLKKEKKQKGIESQELKKECQVLKNENEHLRNKVLQQKKEVLNMKLEQ